MRATLALNGSISFFSLFIVSSLSTVSYHHKGIHLQFFFRIIAFKAFGKNLKKKAAQNPRGLLLPGENQKNR